MADATAIARLLEDEDLASMLQRHRREGVETVGPVWMRSEILQRYACDADQWGDSDDTSSSRDRMRDPFKTKKLAVNEIRQVVQAAGGRQIMQRFERSYRPRSMEAARFGEVMSQIDKAFMAAADAEQAESAAFRDGPLIQGVSCVRWEFDTLEDPRGRIVITDIPITQMMWGRECRQLNLKDRSWHRFGFWMTAREVRERWPKKWKKVFQLAGTKGWANFESPESSSRTPWSGDIGNKPAGEMQPSFFSSRESSFWVELEEWREIEVEYVVAAPVQEGQSYADAIAAAVAGGPDPFQELVLDYKGLNEFMESHLAITGEDVPEQYMVPRKKVVFRYAYIIGTEIMETDLIPVGAFTFLFMTGFRRPSATGTRWISLTENLIQAQKFNNLLLMALWKNLQINPKGLLVYEQGTFKSRKDALDQFTQPGGILEVARGKMTGGTTPFQFVAGGTQGYAQMVESLFSFYRGAIPRLAGFNPGALGDLGPDLRRISGQVVRQTQDAAIQANAEIFDSYRHHRREGGRLFLSFVKTFWGDRLDDLVEIVGEEAVYVDDEQTGELVMALPPIEMWDSGAWRLIDIQEVVPDDDELTELWGALEQGVFQIVQSPQADTGQPLFDSEDLASIIPRIKAPLRDKMLQRIRRAKAQKAQAEADAQAAEQARLAQEARRNQPPPGEGEQQPLN